MLLRTQSLFRFETCLFVLLSMAVAFDAQESRERMLGRRVEDVSLTVTAAEKAWNLHEQAQEADAVVLYFLSTECPVTNRYLPTLNKLNQTDHGSKNVLIVGVNSNVHDSPEEIDQHAAEFELNFPVLSDADGELARQLAVTRTAEAFVLDKQLKVRYRGVIDDRYERGVTKPKATEHYLQDALTATLRGRFARTQITPVEACPLNLADSTATSESTEVITYSEHVAPIVQDNCQTCHRPDGIGPFELMNYEDAKAWSKSIREVVTTNLMPPWHADAPHGHFSNDRSLTEEEYATLLDWIDNGAVEGDKSLLPEPRDFSNRWSIGTPDLVVKMEKNLEIPAETPELGVPYKYIWASEPFKKETWVKSAEVRPGATEIVHHATAYIVPKGVEIELVNDERTTGELDFTSPINSLPYLVAFVPGDNAFELGDGLAKRIPEGARIMFEMHYTPNGKKQTDCTELGLVFLEKPPEHEVLSGGAINYWFSIPPGATDHPVDARTPKFRRDSVLLSMNPHMHFRGKSFKYELIKPDGTKTLLLDVPQYSFDWQTTYWLEEPIEVPKGSYIQCSATFDNSEGNPFNPDATVRVSWGEQSWQEMMLASLEYYEK